MKHWPFYSRRAIIILSYLMYKSLSLSNILNSRFRNRKVPIVYRTRFLQFNSIAYLYTSGLAHKYIYAYILFYHYSKCENQIFHKQFFHKQFFPWCALHVWHKYKIRTKVVTFTHTIRSARNLYSLYIRLQRLHRGLWIYWCDFIRCK